MAKNTLRRSSERAWLVATGLALGMPASAQEGALEEVVVTGSRIARPNQTLPSPVTVIDADAIAAMGLTSPGEVVAQLPQNSNFTSSANVGAGNFNIGAQLANLRGLNPFFGSRTLTLVNTQRFVPTTSGGAVDLNVVPSLLIERTEVITGGASAAYGSDAVAGVVNIILDNRLEGVKVQVDNSATTHGDGNDFHAALAAGTAFAENKGNVIFGAEFQKAQGIGACGKVRDWCKGAPALYTNTQYAGTPASPFAPAIPANGLPHYVIGPNATSLNSYTGLFLGQQFDAAGNALAPYDSGQFSEGAGGFAAKQGGDGPGWYDDVRLRPDVDHYSLYGRASYELTSALESSIELSFSERNASNAQASNGALGFPLDLIFPDNAYLSPDVAAATAAAWADAFAGLAAPPGFTRSTANLLDRVNETNNQVGRAVLGLRGDLPGNWTWDGYYEFGRNKVRQRVYNNLVNDLSYPLLGSNPANSYDFFSWALDAVHENPADPTSPIVCRATAPAYGPVNPNAAGCRPLNLFGLDNADPAALAYAYRTLHEDSLFKEHVVSLAARGDLFDGWGAGSIAGAVGVEYRHDSARVSHDEANQPWYDNYLLSYGEGYAGTISVVEGFAEASVPIVKDRPGAEYLEVTAAVRETHNRNENESTDESSSRTFESWKLGVVYDPVDWLRLRATRSRDARAASFQELYAQTIQTGGLFGSVINPWTGNPQDAARVVLGSNTGLKPEAADTTTAGFVFTPRQWADGLSFSADWYEIKIASAISQVGTQGIVTACFASGAFCQLISGTPNGSGGFADITGIDNLNLNLSSYQVRGVDYQLDYALPFDRFARGRTDRLHLRLIATYLYDLIVDTGSGLTPVDYAGQSGPTAAFGNFNTSPKWQANAFLTYSSGRFTATAQVRYIGAGRYATVDVNTGLPFLEPGDAGYSSTYAASINDNSVASATYLNLAATYTLPIQAGNATYELFGTVNNVFDRDPSVSPGGNGYPTNPVYFDTFGRTWRVGARARFR